MSQPHLSPNDPFVIRNTDNCHQAVDISHCNLRSQGPEIKSLIYFIRALVKQMK